MKASAVFLMTFLMSSLTFAAPIVRECGHKETADESIKDCYEKLGAQKTIECFTFGSKMENIYFSCDQWEEKKKDKVNLYKQRLQDFKLDQEQVWNISEVYVPRDPKIEEPTIDQEKSCGLTGTEEERILDCKNKLGEKKTLQCFAEIFAFTRTYFNCAHWNDFVKENISVTRQTLITLKDYGPKMRQEPDWKTTGKFSPKFDPTRSEGEIIDNYNRPQFPNVSCGKGGSLNERLSDCQKTLESANADAHICYLARANSNDGLRKVPCVAEMELKVQSIPFQSWRLIMLDGSENKIWWDETNKRIWSDLEVKVRSVFKGMKTCSAGESQIMGGISSSEASFVVPTCGDIASAMSKGLRKLMNLEKSKSHKLWCSVESGALLTWDTAGRYVSESGNPFENNSLLCAGKALK